MESSRELTFSVQPYDNSSKLSVPSAQQIYGTGNPKLQGGKHRHCVRHHGSPVTPGHNKANKSSGFRNKRRFRIPSTTISPPGNSRLNFTTCKSICVSSEKRSKSPFVKSKSASLVRTVSRIQFQHRSVKPINDLAGSPVLNNSRSNSRLQVPLNCYGWHSGSPLANCSPRVIRLTLPSGKPKTCTPSPTIKCKITPRKTKLEVPLDQNRNHSKSPVLRLSSNDVSVRSILKYQKSPRKSTLESSQLIKQFKSPIVNVSQSNAVFDGSPMLRYSPSSAICRKTLLRRESYSTIQDDELLDFPRYKLLGSGGFGSVYLSEIRGAKVALKVFHRNGKNSKALVQSFKAEKAASKLRHLNLIEILKTSDTTSGRFVVMEYAGSLNLQQLLLDASLAFESQQRIHCVCDVANAIQYIHENSIAHLDIKPSNIMIAKQDSYKLGDFGCCQEVEQGTGVHTPTHRSYLTGTFAYRAPELLKGNPPTLKADIYALGVTMWQMLTRQVPYSGENQHVVIFGVVAYKLRPTLPKHLPSTVDEWFTDILQQCWSHDPGERPSSETLKDIFGSCRVEMSS